MQFLYDHLVAFALALLAAIAFGLAARLLNKRVTQFAVELRCRLRLVSLAVFLSFATLATIFAQKPSTNGIDGAANPLMMSPRCRHGDWREDEGSSPLHLQVPRRMEVQQHVLSVLVEALCVTGAIVLTLRFLDR